MRLDSYRVAGSRLPDAKEDLNITIKGVFEGVRANRCEGRVVSGLFAAIREDIQEVEKVEDIDESVVVEIGVGER